MNATETTRETTVRQALRIIRADLEGESYLSGALEYECDQGIIFVRNASASDGGYLLSIFEAELTNHGGSTIRKYKV